MQKVICRTAASFAMLLAFADASHAAPQRWNVDIVGLKHVYTTERWPWDDPDIPNVTTNQVDSHGYFTAEDQDGDGTITLSEIDEIHILEDLTLPAYPFKWDQDGFDVSFSYSPQSGLHYQHSGYRYSFVFGESLIFASTGFSSVYSWTSDTRTTVTAAVPEPSGLALAISGMGLCAAWARRSIRTSSVTGKGTRM